GGARNPHVFQYTLRFLRSGGTRPPFARDGFFTNSQPSGFAWAAPHGTGKAIRILNKGSVDLSKLGGQWR
ncbi:MAG: hypothetical protein ACREYE_08425, partial [Gammaproteobacteria bacterium]